MVQGDTQMSGSLGERDGKAVDGERCRNLPFGPSSEEDNLGLEVTNLQAVGEAPF